MAKSYAIWGDWEKHRGKVVLIDGLKYVIRVSVYTTRYPYVEKVISVCAEMVSKRSSAYLTTKRALGDDWMTDILESDPGLYVSVLEQLGGCHVG